MEAEKPILVPQRNTLVPSFRDYYIAFSERRAALGLSYPGTVENVAKEVQRDVFLNNSMFTGLRADLAKSFSADPMFQTAHAFSMGSQGIPPYTFLSSFGTPKLYMQGVIDNDGQLAARANYRWTGSFITRTQAQIAPGVGQAMIQFDNDYSGRDFSAALKAINPSMLDGGPTGIFIGSYLQSVSPGLALGFEAMWSRAAMNTGPETAVSYFAKYKGSDWIASAQFQAQGAISTSYWRKLTDRVEVGTDLTLQFLPGVGGRGGLMGGRSQKEGSATLGAKYSFRGSIFRAQVDSQGRLGALLERQVLPMVNLAFAGELDQVKQQARVGLGVSVELPNEDTMQQQERMMASGIPLPPM